MSHALTALGLAVAERPEALLVRGLGIRLDYYPSTGRWRDLDRPQQDARNGGGQAFVAWVRRRLAARRP